MRILHINCNYISTALHQTMVETLDSLGTESQVYAPTYDRSLAVIRPNSNVIVSECFRKWDRVAFDYKQGKILRDIRSKVEVSSFDCIHAYTLFTDGNCAMRLSQETGVPYVVAVRDTDVNTFFRYMKHLRSRGVSILRNASAVFFLSQAYEDLVMQTYIPARYHQEILKKSFIIPNGIQDFWIENRYQAHDLPAAGLPLRLIFAGRINKRKNLPTTAEAVRQLIQRGLNVTLTVVGKIEDQTEYEKICHEPFLTYVPAKPKEELLTLYREHHIFVMPSHTETFGLVYAEAMSQGLPVVYTRGQGFDGQFPEGQAGYSVDDTDASQVAEAVLKVLSRYSEISGACPALVDKFIWKDICQKYLDIYKLISKKDA